MKEYSLLVVFLLLSITSFCQPSISRMESLSLFKGPIPQKIIQFKIENTTTDTIYIWLQKKDSCFDVVNNFAKYFFCADSEFPLSVLCFDRNVFFESPYKPVIGDTFIKRLDPGETFNIFSLDFDGGTYVIQYETLINVKKFVSPHRLDSFNYSYDYLLIDFD